MTNPLDNLTAVDKSEVLLEALPWLQEFEGEIVVVKYGGHAMTDEHLKAAFAKDVTFLRQVGLKPVVVHGGGPQINAMLARLGIDSEFKKGLRVTTPEVMEVVRMVLTGVVQREIVSLINADRPYAVGLSGEDATFLTAEVHHPVIDGTNVDIGLVGDVVKVAPGAVKDIINAGRIPVISSVAPSRDGQLLNVNADTAAAAIAGALGARKLVVLTDVEGVYRDFPDKSSIIPHMSLAELNELLPTMSEGMIPKLQACLAAIEAGVKEAHIVDGRKAHSLLLEIFTDVGVGTRIDSPLKEGA
ncbi:acetylglutamate kinase [Bowdeniella massiliensis]|uniref:acetylglutamate kinase n=1 Tax=Bowdeniella massiliensis TaxID=2932264 RepID=UPI002028E32F|nr:acetylglutamate kinase [Bowdeniella massiliensis]